MAGPTSSILIKNIPDEYEIGKVYNIIDSISIERKGNNFSVNSTKKIGGHIESVGQPFGIKKHEINPDYYEYTNEEVEYISNIIGFQPKFDIGFYAMCNGAIDHKILGELTCYVAKEFEGIIDFRGNIEVETQENFQGKLFKVPYIGGAGTEFYYHICNIEFMEWWLEDYRFHMIK